MAAATGTGALPLRWSIPRASSRPGYRPSTLAAAAAGKEFRCLRTATRQPFEKGSWTRLNFNGPRRAAGPNNCGCLGVAQGDPCPSIKGQAVVFPLPQAQHSGNLHRQVCPLDSSPAPLKGTAENVENCRKENLDSCEIPFSVIQTQMDPKPPPLYFW